MNSCVQDLDQNRWPATWHLSPWKALQRLECRTCQVERARRCRVIAPQNANAKAHLDHKFAQAPFIQPAKVLYAQLLHAVTFAKATGKKILWLVARDMPHDSTGHGIETLRKQQQQWLQLHDRSTAGILGMLPLIEGMPIRFTRTRHGRLWSPPIDTSNTLGVLLQ